MYGHQKQVRNDWESDVPGIMQATKCVGLFFFCFILILLCPAHEELVEGCLFCLHFWCSKWPLRAVVLVNSAPQSGQLALVACPDFSR